MRKLSRRSFLAASMAGAAMTGLNWKPVHGRNTGDKPNVVVIVSDDQGWGDLGIHGNTNLNTPNIDGMAEEGALFEWFYVQPVCSPTRADLLTGRYFTRSNVHGTSRGQERMNLGETTIAESFKAAGYATGCFGKWHGGAQYPYHPLARGFDEYYGFCSGHWGQYFDWYLEHNGEWVDYDGYITDDLTTQAMAFMEEQGDDPFFVYVPYNTPHSPMQVPDEYYDRFDGVDVDMRYQGGQEEDMAMTRAAHAMNENIDSNVGRIMDKLAELGLDENTILVFLGDNGPNSWRWNGGMRGRKGSTDEGGVRVPGIIRWARGIRPGQRIKPIAGAIDLLPTLTDLAGIEHVGEAPLDGVSLKPLLMGETEANDWPDRMIFSCWGQRVSVRTQRFRLDHEGRLYDMEADIGQTTDVSEEHPEEAARLAEAAQQWKDETFDGYGAAHDDRPFPVGYPAFPVTHLPARDGVAHGSIERSNRFPNASFFENWTEPEDHISWDIEVNTTGRYEATVYYTCPEEDVGSTIELRFGDAAVRSTIETPHDPPLVGAEYDRVPRMESYVKDFKAKRLGEFKLVAGRGPLTLRATDIAGEEVMDVRRVTLKLLDA
ncbi:MAG: sulfatase-like hydrolase/transferase [Candidatus Hydrogenedentota bacterium]